MKKLKWFLLRVTIFCLAATYGLGQLGLSQRNIDAFGKFTYTLKNGGTLQEAAHILQGEFTLRSRIPEIQNTGEKTQSLAQGAPLISLLKKKEIGQDTAGADGQNRRRWKTMV